MKIFSTKHLPHRGRGSSKGEERKNGANMLKVAGGGCSVERLAGVRCPEWHRVIDKLRMI